MIYSVVTSAVNFLVAFNLSPENICQVLEKCKNWQKLICYFETFQCKIYNVVTSAVDCLVAVHLPLEDVCQVPAFCPIFFYCDARSLVGPLKILSQTNLWLFFCLLTFFGNGLISNRHLGCLKNIKTRSFQLHFNFRIMYASYSFFSEIRY